MHTIALGTLNRDRLSIPGADAWFVAPTDPALGVMTDFRERNSVTVAETATIDEALEHMKHTGVRCAFAIDDTDRAVSGMITAYDIMGEKPMLLMRATELRRRDLVVRDLMLRTSAWPVVDVRDLEASTVAAVAELFDRVAVTHVAVIERVGHDEPRLRGILSAAKVRRLLSRHRDVAEFQRGANVA